MITALLTVGDTRVLYIVQIIIIKPFKIIIFKLCLNKKRCIRKLVDGEKPLDIMNKQRFAKLQTSNFV